MIGFSGSPLDRGEQVRRDEAALAALPGHPGARWALFDGLKPAMLGEGGADGLAWVPRDAVPDPSASVLLGLAPDGSPRFATPGSPPPGAAALDARMAAMTAPAADMGVVAHARSLLDWHATHRFCANCGQPTEPRRGGAIRVCPACATEHYPRVNPVAIMLVIDPATDSVLLGRGPRMPPGFLSCLAGFVEPGETLEEAVRRETREEAGVIVGTVRYLASQPWPFPSQLMLGAHADALSTGIKIDPHEIESAAWFPRAEVAAALQGAATFRLPPRQAIAHHLIERWLGGGSASSHQRLAPPRRAS